jgi:gephyrin
MGDDKLRAGILIVSETAANDPSTDKTTSLLKEVFESEGGGQWHVAEERIISDDVLEIQRSVRQWADGEDFLNLIITSGGTGFAQKDHTPEVG